MSRKKTNYSTQRKKRTNRVKKGKKTKRVKRTIRVKRTKRVKKKNQQGSGFLKTVGSNTKKGIQAIGSKAKEGTLQVAYEGKLKGSQASRLLFQKKINDLKAWCKNIESLQPK